MGVIKSKTVFYRVLPLPPAPGIKYLNPDTHFSWNNHTTVSEVRSQSGAAQAGAACAGSLGQAGLLPGLGVADAHEGFMHTWMSRNQRDTKVVIFVVARVGLVAKHCFLSREGSSVQRCPARTHVDGCTHVY